MIPAPWVWGPRRRASAYDRVFGVPEYEIMRQRGLPATMFDDANHMLPDNSHFGREADIKAGNDTLHAWGFKVAAYNTPYISQDDPMAGAEFQYGVDNKLFQLTPAGDPALTVFISGSLHTLATIDLSHPLGFAWYKTLLKRSIDLGYDGWMNDFGEYTKRDSVMADGTDGNVHHNAFPVLSAKAAHEVLEENKPNDYLFFVRSGYVGTQQYASQVWGGDSEASFDDTQGLPSAVRGGLNLGLVGVSQYGSDTTGFKCIAGDKYDKEVYIRWLEFAAVSPIFHEENACANPIAPQKKWNLWNDDETQDAWRNAASFHTRLAPYLRALSVEANATGTPIMRHPFLTHPDEPEGFAVEDSYFFGGSLYAAPVVRRGLSERNVWLPKGRYVEWSEHTVHEGPAFVTVPAPLMRLPLFLVENTLVPMLDADVQTLAPATEPSVVSETNRLDVLDVVAALGPAGEAEMTLADGTVIRIHRGETQTSVLTPVAAEALKTCAACAAPSDVVGAVSRIRFNSELAAEVSTAFEDVHAVVVGPTARRYRFEIWRTTDANK
jgi:alpha-glucosidase (family GH31 glycosyl hydrolase)